MHYTSATFTPSTTVTLQPNTKYWFVLRGIATDFLSAGMVVGTAPTAAGVTYLNSALSNDAGSTWSSFGTTHFVTQVNASSPAPVSAPIDLHFSKQVETTPTKIEVK